MLLIKKQTKLIFIICFAFLIQACIPSPKPQERVNTVEKEIKALKKNNNKSTQYKVIEESFEIIHEGLNQEEVKKELLLLHQKEIKDYVIGTGDIFNIFVYEEQELNIKGSIVKNDGSLTFQLIGDIKVAGLTINQAMNKVAKKFKRYILNPIVTIVPVEFKSKSFTILGKISKPGTYQIINNSKLIDSIAIAEGLSIGIFENNSIELADLEHAFIRRDNKVLPINFIELVRKGNSLHNIPLKDKDYIYIPSALNKEVYVLGEVKITGHYGFKEKMTLTQVISHAKGYTTKANINNVAIIRGTLNNPIVYIANLQNILEGKNRDFYIKPFDIIFVPSSTLGDWNNILTMLMPSLETLQNAYIINQLNKGD